MSTYVLRHPRSHQLEKQRRLSCSVAETVDCERASIRAVPSCNASARLVVRRRSLVSALAFVRW